MRRRRKLQKMLRQIERIESKTTPLLEDEVCIHHFRQLRPYFYENLVRITGKNLRIRKRNSAPGGVASITTNGEHARSTDYVR